MVLLNGTYRIIVRHETMFKILEDGYITAVEIYNDWIDGDIITKFISPKPKRMDGYGRREICAINIWNN